MADLSTLQADVASKLGIAARTVRSRIQAKEDDELVPRHIAALMVAQEAGLSPKKYATVDEIEQLRKAKAGTAYTSSTDSSAHTDAPARARSSSVARRTVAPTRRPKGKTVFVVHGRNEPLRKAMFAFLRSAGLNPLEWSTALRSIGTGTPTILQIIEHMVQKSAGVVVLLTPDDLAQLKPELAKKNESDLELRPSGQARPNVLFEAGIAIALFPENTVLVQIGAVKAFTDIGGVHVMHMNNSSEARNEFVQKLQSANLLANSTGNDWLSEGDFEQETY